ncbi:DUF4375 domain-containing protein [Novosphingobium sp.]|uniref:DMP19 family protein n=1 Tax=Novosphingobium sp. TaxID=1874826 RepID=UPI0025E3FAF4|nr:DUF4375 domain-containing protein [Novosphingobium sp.]
MQKLPCIECGALILPTTAESTGGRCMACKQGIRKSMEASRVYYKRQKEYDPFRELRVSLVNCSSQDRNLTNWSDQEAKYFSMALLEGEIYNGGFDQYFSNSSGGYYLRAVGGLRDIKAFSTLNIVEEAAQLIFGSLAPPKTQEDRWRIMYDKSNELSAFTPNFNSEKLEKLDKLFCSDPDGLVDRLSTYAEFHDLLTPFRISQG